MYYKTMLKKLSSGGRLFQYNRKIWESDSEPFIHCYTKCEAFCWFSRWSDKRSFSLSRRRSYLSEGLRAISHYLGWEKKEKLKFGRSQATYGIKRSFSRRKNFPVASPLSPSWSDRD